MITDEMLPKLPDPHNIINWQHYYTPEQVRAAQREAYAAGLEAAQAWRPIETAPKDGTVVLGSEDEVEDAYKCWYDHFFNDWRSLEFEIAVNPTVWQPLPAPPAAHQDTTKEGRDA